MYGDFIYSEDVRPVKSAGSHRLEKGFKTFIIAAAAILILELIWLFAVAPCMPLSKIDVMTFPGMDRAAVIAAAGIGERSSFVSVNPREAEKALGELYAVESARVTKRFPNTVKIVLVPRSAVAVSLTLQDGRLVPVYFDRHGLVFKVGGMDGGEVPPPSLPLISGLVFAPPVLGTRLPAIFGTFLAGLQSIGDSAPELLGAISEIRINRKPFDGFDLVLYPVHSPVRIRLESDLNEETLRDVMLMLDVFASKNFDIEEIDFRAETASYKIKEASSG
ncbi:cell division protein FtsQ [Spirochaetia bacterium]|nr:cell division protein FtsQ [Spirochaetia bacterium]